MKFAQAAAAALALVFAGPAFSQAAMSETGWYVGGSIGQMTADDACAGLTGAGVSCDDEDTTWKIFGGYKINRNFAAELGYSDLGEVSARGPGGTATAEATAWELVGVGMLPLADRFSAYGKLGVYRGEVDGRVNTVLLNASADESNTDLTFGLGLKYDVSQAVAIRGEWQRYGDIGGNSTGEADLDVISIGVMFQF